MRSLASFAFWGALLSCVVATDPAAAQQTSSDAIACRGATCVRIDTIVTKTNACVVKITLWPRDSSRVLMERIIQVKRDGTKAVSGALEDARTRSDEAVFEISCPKGLNPATVVPVGEADAAPNAPSVARGVYPDACPPPERASRTACV